MDSDLAKAACSGKVEQLRKVLDVCQKSHNRDLRCCFLPQGEGENIFHLSGRKNRVEFFQEAIRILPDPLVHELLNQSEPSNGWNPLHVAAKVGHLAIVNLIFGFYQLSESDKAPLLAPKPWLALDFIGRTPLHLGLCHGKDECVMEMISMLVNDIEQICNMPDKEGNSLLVIAVSKGCNQVARHILTHVSSYSLSAKNDNSLLHFVMNSSEEVFALLLDKHPEYKEKVDYTVFRKWAEAGKGKLWPWEYLLNTVSDIKSKRHLVNFIYHPNNLGNNIFHVVAKGRKFEAAKTLANVYRDDKETNPDVNVPWLVPNKKNATPQDLAMADYANDEYKQLKQEIIDKSVVTQGKRELLFVAIEKQLYLAAEGILDIHLNYGWSLYRPGEWRIWDAALEHSEEAAKWVAEKMLNINQDEFVKHSLCSASKNGKTEFVEWMLKKKSNALKVAPLSWLEACRQGHISTIKAFINNSRDFFELCYEAEDTPLHHMRLNSYEQYQDILKNEVMLRLKNFQDSNDQTPLHKAVESRNLFLAKMLLSMDDVSRSIKDKSQHTAMDLLVEACNGSWEWKEMCKQIGIVPGIEMTYFQGKTNLLEVRNTLSVVAVLLATITFTAGFTLPGGVKSDTSGKATLGNKAAFLLFLTADALAMCCSMLVLVCLIWSMVCDYDISLILIDGSVPLLMIALYSTLVAFTTGVYVVIPHKSSWICIVILVMCFIFVILSIRGVMNKLLILCKKRINYKLLLNKLSCKISINYKLLLNKLSSASRRRSKDEIVSMELGQASSTQEGNSSWIRRNANAYLEGINSRQQKSE